MKCSLTIGSQTVEFTLDDASLALDMLQHIQPQPIKEESTPREPLKLSEPPKEDRHLDGTKRKFYPSNEQVEMAEQYIVLYKSSMTWDTLRDKINSEQDTRFSSGTLQRIYTGKHKQ